MQQVLRRCPVSLNRVPSAAVVRVPRCCPAGRALRSLAEYSPWPPLNNIRINQRFAVTSAAAREFLLGPFLVTAPLRRHLDHNPQSRFLRSRWLAFLLQKNGHT